MMRVACLLLVLLVGTAPVAWGAGMVRQDFSVLARNLAREGEAQLAQGNLAQARDYLHQALLANPGAAPTFTLLARLAYAEENWKEANRLLVIANNIAPKQLAIVIWQARVALAQNDMVAANSHWALAQELCADCAETQELGQTLAARKTP